NPYTSAAAKAGLHRARSPARRRSLAHLRAPFRGPAPDAHRRGALTDERPRAGAQAFPNTAGNESVVYVGLLGRGYPAAWSVELRDGFPSEAVYRRIAER